MGVLFVLLAEPMFRVFCPEPHLQPVIDAGVPALAADRVCDAGAGVSQIIFTAALRGAGDSRVPVLFSWFGFLCVRIPLAYLLTAPRSEPRAARRRSRLRHGLARRVGRDVYRPMGSRRSLFALRFASGKWKHQEV